jgi:hypothetical protein
LEKVRPLAELEMKLGFRSCFNFIPEGPHSVPLALRSWLVAHGFEVGVHDLHHDGHLFRSRAAFAQNATRINRYIKEWNAVGFRAGFMLHNLDWQHDLQVLWDASTFDTDPFEPQPDGVGTIFPFWVQKAESRKQKAAPNAERGTRNAEPGPRTSDFSSQLSAFSFQNAPPPLDPRPSTLDPRPSTNSPIPHSAFRIPHSGYVELPYTLPQDSTLFLLLHETTPEIWLRKLDWIAQHGGMALVNVHPDYLRLPGEAPSSRTFPVEHYSRLLEHVQQKHAGSFWPALPREAAAHVRHVISLALAPADSSKPRPAAQTTARQKPRIWIDLDNTPHVPFFEPIIEELRTRGYPVLVTARDAFQVCDLARKNGMPIRTIGRHHGRNRVRKIAGLFYRALQLAPAVLREKPVLAVSHGSRSQFILSNWLRIPSLLIEDYEFSRFPFMMRPAWVLAPEVIPAAALCGSLERVLKYPGIKEDVYAWKLQPDPAILRELGVNESQVIALVRPPATEAHYHNPESEKILVCFMERAMKLPQLRIVLLPRNEKQAADLRHQWPAWFAKGKTTIPHSAVDGLNLIYHCDLVVSGGGTMNREAAALGVPVYSIFRGAIGAVDRALCAQGRLILIESEDDVDRKIRFAKRPRQPVTNVTSRRTLDSIVNTIVELAAEAEAKRH